MTRLLEFLIAIGIVIALFLVVGLVLPSHRELTKSVESNRKMSIVFDTLNNTRRFKDWNPLVLQDPKMKLEYKGAAAGKTSQLDYASDNGQVGDGSWTIVDSVQDKSITYQLQNSQMGDNKTMKFDLAPTGKNGRNVKITQSYSVDYGWNLFGRFAGLYVSRHVGDTVESGLARLSNVLATVPNFDYRVAGTTLVNLSVVDVPSEDTLVIVAGNIERNNEAIKTSLRQNMEWMKRVMDANGLEASGPFRIVTTDFGMEKYAFDIALPIRKRAGGAPKPATPATPVAEGDAAAAAAAAPAAPMSATPVAATGPTLTVKIDGGAPVKYIRTEAHKSAFGQYTGHMAGLDVVRNSVRAWATTNGYEVADRPYESWKSGIDGSFTDTGSFDVYWAVK